MAGFGPVLLVDSLGRLVWWVLVLDVVIGFSSTVVLFGLVRKCEV